MDAPLQLVTPKPAESTPQAVKPNASKKPKEGDWNDDIWSAVKSDYRTGTSYGKLSETYAIPVELIVRRKQREAWRRDLSNEVRSETLAALAVDDSALGSSGATDEQVVQAAARRGAEVVKRHRNVLATALEACASLAGDLRKAAAQVSAEKPVTNLAFLGPKETLAECALKLGNALDRIIRNERKAFGLDDGGEAKPFEEALHEWNASKAAERQARGG